MPDTALGMPYVAPRTQQRQALPSDAPKLPPLGQA
jgi:hypothetical protein